MSPSRKNIGLNLHLIRSGWRIHSKPTMNSFSNTLASIKEFFDAHIKQQGFHKRSDVSDSLTNSSAHWLHVRKDSSIHWTYLPMWSRWVAYIVPTLLGNSPESIESLLLIFLKEYKPTLPVTEWLHCSLSCGSMRLFAASIWRLLMFSSPRSNLVRYLMDVHSLIVIGQWFAMNEYIFLLRWSLKDKKCIFSLWRGM